MDLSTLISPVRAKRPATFSPPKSPHPKRKRIHQSINERESLHEINRKSSSNSAIAGLQLTGNFQSNIDCLTSLIESQNLQAPHAVRGLTFATNFGGNAPQLYRNTIPSITCSTVPKHLGVWFVCLIPTGKRSFPLFVLIHFMCWNCIILTWETCDPKK